MSFDLTKFRALFPEFSPVADERIELHGEMASCFVWPYAGCCTGVMTLYLVAHLLSLEQANAEGAGPSGPMTSASIAQVSVGMQGPPVKSGWQQWLSLSPYGLTLWALLARRAAGGVYIGGWPERRGFRKGGGVF